MAEGITNYNAVDRHVGRQIKLRRNFLGMTQQDLARRLDITFQQVQKYERGANRVSASRLWDLSQIMKTDVGYFFEDMPQVVQRASPRQMAATPPDVKELDDVLSAFVTDPMLKRETMSLLRSYYLIKTPHLRKKLAMMIRTAAEKDQESTERPDRKGVKA